MKKKITVLLATFCVLILSGLSVWGASPVVKDLIVKESPWVDVRAYAPKGTLADGTVDWTAYIQAALNFGGDTYLPKGIYLISNALSYKSNTVIRGAGEHLTTIINTTGRTDTKTILKPYLNSGSDNVHIKDLTLNQSGSSYSDSTSDMSISIDNCFDITLSNVQIKNSITVGLWAGTKVRKLKVLNSTVDTSRGGGISLFGDISDVEIIGNFFYSCKDDALAFQDLAGGIARPRGIAITGNIFKNNNTRNTYGSTPHAILIYGGSDVSITGNVVDNTVSDSIAIIQGQTFRSVNINATGNVISNSGNTSDNTSGVPRSGIRVYHSDNVLLSSNTITDSRNHGILSYDANGLSIIGNTIHNSYQAGIYLWDTLNALISSNTASNSGSSGTGSAGIFLESTDNVSYNNNISITGNSLYDTRSGASRTQLYGIYVSGVDSKYVNFSNNTTYNNAVSSVAGSYAVLSNSRFENNFGTSKRTVGVDTLTSPSNTVVVTHNLNATPTVVIITPYLAKSLYVSSRDSTTFTVTNATDSNSCAFDWIAEIQ